MTALLISLIIKWDAASLKARTKLIKRNKTTDHSKIDLLTNQRHPQAPSVVLT